VTAEHSDYSTLLSLCLDDRRHQATKIAGDQDVGKRRQEVVKGAFRARRLRELVGGDFVGSPSDWDCANGAEIGLSGARRA
jgi:hypothetical protein